MAVFIGDGERPLFGNLTADELPMAHSKSDTPSEDRRLDLDSVAALISMGPQYLLQHREDRQGISYPNCWGLFGGAREDGESAVDALRREMLEELNLAVAGYEPLLTCTYELWFEGRRTRKAFFSVELSEAEARKIILGEGQGMAWLRFEEIMARASQVVPYDLGIIALHDRGIERAAFRSSATRPASEKGDADRTFEGVRGNAVPVGKIP
jgi:8-oxo-dGTP pyrophosphatase MutT (NUDIX family)